MNAIECDLGTSVPFPAKIASQDIISVMAVRCIPLTNSQGWQARTFVFKTFSNIDIISCRLMTIYGELSLALPYKQLYM